ncbi:hypothetical protein GO730_33750 [Spirosoma sp. HMF3257]|uniref:Sigma-70 family RNA polymerase sigma factor n=1 Tax=Spirosoma telluris TaxID=2183553 RepID=A0A327NSZ9_9BACT|nr:hypothetical protein [Spirosoma telluris]RAI77845.1 hypothetical protein HMF3257_33655 [Spirosoma telluris]
MRALKHFDGALATQAVNRETNCLSLYDRFGALAYGIILQIIPEPEIAQTVLVDLFSSLPIEFYAEGSDPVSSELIRLARKKALAAKPERYNRSLSSQEPTTNDDLGKLVFDLSFYQGFSVEDIADKLQLTKTNVLSMIYAYFKQQRS